MSPPVSDATSVAQATHLKTTAPAAGVRTVSPADAAASPLADRTKSPVAATDATDDEHFSNGESLGLTASDRRFLWSVGGCGVLLAGVHWLWLSGWGLQEVEIDRLPERRYDFRVDINRATWVEWMQLEGIGELTARRIVADRMERGPFRSIDDLDRVSGIGPKTLQAIRPWLECSDGTAAREDR